MEMGLPVAEPGAALATSPRPGIAITIVRTRSVVARGLILRAFPAAAVINSVNAGS